MENLEIKNSKLDGLRSQIDEIDKNMAILFEQRMIIIYKTFFYNYFKIYLHFRHLGSHHHHHTKFFH